MRWRDRLSGVRRDTLALYFCARDRRVGWPARALGLVVVAYALSPIDLIPDFIPVLGYLDDAVLIPAGLVLFRKMVPATVFEEQRARAEGRLAEAGPGAKIAAAVVVLLWLGLAALVALALLR